MIKLNVDTYCHSCDNFEPVAEKQDDYDFVDGEYVSYFEVQCVNKELCYNLWKHMLNCGKKENYD